MAIWIPFGVLSVVILLKYYIMGNDSGATASVSEFDDRLEVKAGGGLYSLFGVWVILFAAMLGYPAASMILRAQAGAVEYTIGALLGALSCKFLFDGVKWLFERRKVIVDRSWQEAISTLRLIVRVRTERLLISEFDKITLARRTVGSGYKGTTYYKVRMKGPSSGLDLDCNAVLEYEIAQRLAESAARITNLPIEDRVQ